MVSSAKSMNSSKIRTYVKLIESSKVYDVAQITPITKANQLSKALNNEVLLKREDLQPVFSFKIRGAYNKLAKLKQKGVKGPFIAASAGNHAQGVAFGAKNLGLKAFIVMPVTTPSIKVNSVKNYGGKVILHGDNFDEAYQYAAQLVSKEGYTFIHPFDDKDVIAGQGTVGKELIEQLDSDIDAIFVPVGGGGLLAGLGTYVKAFSPKTKIIGVEPHDAACLKLALDNNKRLSLAEVGLFADGVAVKQIGKENFSLIKEWIDEVVTVSVDEMCAAVQDTFQETRTIAEPAGALALAGLKKYSKSRGLKNKRLVAINSGANLNFDRLGHIVERVQLGESKEALLGVKIPEQKGSFRKFCNLLGKRSISEFNYRAEESEEANIFVACRFNEKEGKGKLFKHLKSKGFLPKDLSDNEIAKLHIKHMVGGRAPKAIVERGEYIFRVEFPERPAALVDFLDKLSDKFNITLFHYRNQGSAYGRVLVGFESKEKNYPKLVKYLSNTGFRFWDETQNSAYKAFLK
jgi:threonine dehydratase